ncbi:MAG: neuraminidase-like domain-containing protein [Planctomycetota bacterium]
MRAIQAPIKPGEDVANLQDALLALFEKGIIWPRDMQDLPTPDELQKLSDGLRRERVKSQPGDFTEQFVMNFRIQQDPRDIPRDGSVDENTAAKLNYWLKKLKLLDTPDIPQPPVVHEPPDIPEPEGFIVRGTVTNSDGQPLSGAIVRAFDRDMRKDQWVGENVTNILGQFVISYGPSQFATGDVPTASAPSLIVRAFVGDQQIGNDVTRKPAERVEIIHFQVPAQALSDWERTCAGVIPLLMGQGEGDKTLPPWEINDRDLDFIVEETGLERENIRLWALAFAVGRDAALVMSPVGGTGAPTHALPFSGNAVELSTFAIYYGWFQFGHSTEPVPLWATPTDTLVATLKSAILQGVVPSSISAHLDSIRARIEQIKLDRVLQAPAFGTAASLGDLFATMPVQLNPDQQRVIAAAVNELRLDDPKLVEKIAGISGFDGDAVGVARTLRIGALTGGHLPLAGALQSRLQLAEESEGTLRPLAALRSDEWIDLAFTHGTPNVAYANALAAIVERQYPTAALAAHVAEGRRLSKQPLLADVGTFLRDNPDFDIETANLNVLTEQAELGGVGQPKQLQLVEGLRTLKNMHVLASWDETATLLENDLHTPHQLLAAGPGQLTALLDGQLAPERVTALYRQAEELHNVTFAAITAAFSPLSGPRVLPGQFSFVAEGREINPDDLGGGGSPTISPEPFPDDDGSGGSLGLKTLEEVLASRGGEFDPKKAITLREQPSRETHFTDGPTEIGLGGVIDHQPTLRVLFGDQDACACGHCNSVLSPAAYFVDVLQFIKNAGILDFLLKRRPDLQDLELSCDNTNTVVPAIDLALEILENAVALPLEVELDDSTDVEAQLWPTVGVEVRSALEKTVRNLAGEVRAVWEDGAWTVVDGHRRWKINAQNKAALKAGTLELDTTGLDLPAVIAALDQGQIASGAEATFARLFAAGHVQPPDYKVTITPLPPMAESKSWRVEYQYEARLLINRNIPKVELQTPSGVAWWNRVYKEVHTAQINADLSGSVVPTWVQVQLALRFYNPPPFTLTPAGTDTWTIASAKRELTLRFEPAQLTIASLAYQSGDPDADALAWPENHNPEAYVQLKKEKFPWSLPVDLPLEEVRLFLERARSSRLRLIELMMPVDRLLQDDAPVNGLPAAQSTPEDTPLVFSKKNRNAIKVADRMGDRLNTTVSTTNGTLEVLANPSVKVNNNGKESVTIGGMADDINGALDGMAFTPTADYNGTVKLTITTTGDAGTHVDSLNIAVTPVADIAEDSATTEEDNAVTIPVLANDSFENPDRRITAINGLAIIAGGSVVPVTHGTVALTVSGQLIFTPALGYNGPASFTYTVTSGDRGESAIVYVAVNSADDASFALEVLGLNKAEATFIGANETDPVVYNYWGVSSDQEIIWDAAAGSFLKGASPLVLLKSVSILLQQSRLSFEELQAMIETRFVKPDGTAALSIVPASTCKPSEMRLPALTPEHLDRLHRFTRLWHKLGWTMRELDLAIEALGGQLTRATLIGLARLKLLNQRLELPVASLVGGLHQLETRSWINSLMEGATVQPSLYSAIFQREAVRSVSDYANFALDPNGIELVNPILSISARADYVGTCLGIKSSIVADWVSSTHGLGIEDKLNLANLSRLTAAANLCRGLGISHEKLTHHLELYGLAAAPFRSGMNAHERADAMLEFVKRFRFVERSGIDVETLRYLLQHYEAPVSNTTLDEKQLMQLTGAARDAVQSIPDPAEKSPPLALAAAEEAARAIRLAREDATIAALATGLGAERELVDEMLRTRLRHPSITSANEAAIAAFLDTSFVTIDVSHSPTTAEKAVEDILVRLHKAVFICDALKLNRADLRLLRTSATDASGFTALDFNTLPATATDPVASLDGFNQLLELSLLRGTASGAGDLLHRYAAINFSVVGMVGAAHTILATGLGLEKSEVAAAANQLHITGDQYLDPMAITTSAKQYRDPITLSRLIELLVALKQLGATVAQANDLTAPSPDDRAAIVARELLRGKYGESQWHDLIKPIADKLRIRQRDALVDYLIARDQLPRAGDGNPQLYTGPRLRDADDLYECYLIDVQTGSCLKTTRLLQATAAAQLFVQRVILNLERHLSLTPDKRKLWDWMRSYRVWEANRKVFLFPENWLLPELRDDKTAIFRQMESVLTEKEPSPEITRTALLTYLEELGDLAQISVIAMYEDERKIDETIVAENGAPKTVSRVERTLYVVGRTPNESSRYYWRSCTNFGDDAMSWSGWEALDLDNANDFIMPFVMEGDLHVAWPIFRKKVDEKNQANLLWEVQIAWTRRTSQGWVKRKIGKAQLGAVKRLENEDSSQSFAFRLAKDVSKVSILGSKLTVPREKINIYCYAAGEATVEATKASEFIPELLFEDNPDPLPVRLPKSVEDNQGNVQFELRGQLYEFAVVDGVKKYRPLKAGTKVTIQWEYFVNSFVGFRDEEKEEVTDVNGVFTFNPFYYFPNSNEIDHNYDGFVANGKEVKLTWTWPSGDPGKVEGVLEKDQKRYSHWKWTFSAEKESKDIADDFKTGRVVNYNPAGRFIVESGKDLSSDSTLTNMPSLDGMKGLSVDGNRFASLSDAKGLIPTVAFGPNDSWGPPAPGLTPPLVITRAIQGQTPGSAAKPHVWYLQDNNGSSYLQKREGIWHRWADGHPSASSYRTVATPSTNLLFSKEVQTDLVDSVADNFLRRAPYANYNWELFLHAPLAIADYLASQQRFEDARRWLHAVFDPTTDAMIGTSQVPQFWRFLPFQKDSQPNSIARMLTWLADPKTTDLKVKGFETKFAAQIEEWKKNPFMPHLIARLRPSAYQWHTFFAYLDVLIGWGDQLFRRDTRESVNEATLLYVLAAKLLGPRPRVIPAPTPPPPQTYRSLRANKLDEFSNAWVSYSELPGVTKLFKQSAQTVISSYAQVAAGGFSNTATTVGSEGITFGGAAVPGGNTGTTFGGNGEAGVNTGITVENPDFTGVQIVTSLSALAFCIPQNEKVTEFYDRIENRLFNVRNCRNIEGVFRDLPLYEPPIDPLLLIRARAAGLDINDAMVGQYAPLPNYRFSFTLQKALELCSELKALGGALLTALEKKDAEELTLLRSSHEIAMLKLVSETRKQQIAEAEANIAALRQSEVTIFERFGQYQKLLGKPGITKGQDGLPVVEQSSSLAVSTDTGGGASGLGLVRKEVEQLGWTATANTFTQVANTAHVLAGVLSAVPTLAIGTFVANSSIGGLHLGGAASAIAKAIEMGAVNANYLANLAGTFAGYERRQDEWVHQSKLALAEMKQIQKQILAAEIRKSIAEREFENHDKQIENAQQIDEFMRGKFTNQQLYRWMSSQIAQVYFRTYQLALDQARRAERAYRHELGLDNKTTPFVQAGQWDSLKRGLLAGEHLHHDLKRMESAYLERNVREFELTKHVSIALLDPFALVMLRETGRCTVVVPEEIFDLDYPGHYFRRIKSVSLTLPCVVGPYTTISCTLRLESDSIRVKTTIGVSGYPRITDPSAGDPRFVENSIPVKAIAASSAQNDSGVFELSFRDERYLPFEGAGAVSRWSLELFNDQEFRDPNTNEPDFGRPLRQFDYKTISDAILHVKYTAREDAGDFKNRAVTHLRTFFNQNGATPSLRMFNLRQEFPTQWQRFLSPTTANEYIFEFEMSPSFFRIIDGGKTLKVNTIWLLARCTNPLDNCTVVITRPLLPAPPAPAVASPIMMTLIPSDEFGGLLFDQKDVKEVSPSVTIAPAHPPVRWQLAMTGHHDEDPQNALVEVEEVLLVLGYEWV